MMKKHLLLSVLVLLPMLAGADPVEINGIYYNLDSDAKTAEVTKNPSHYTGSVVIPSSVSYGGATYTVTAIGERAFYPCQHLTSVTLPGSLTTMGKDAFNGGSGFNSVTLPSSLTKIGNATFYGCSGLTSTSSDYTFMTTPIENVTLHVPEELLSSYQSTAPWSNFGSIVPITPDDPQPTIIVSVPHKIITNNRYYKLDGYEVDHPTKGIYIQGGKKVVIK